MKDTTTKRSAAFLNVALKNALFPEAKRRGFLAVCAVLLAGALALTGCGDKKSGDPTSPGGGTPFDGSTLVGTTWVKTVAKEAFLPGLTFDGRFTFVFTTATKGTCTAELTGFHGDWSEEMKTKVRQGMVTDYGPFTYIYDPAAKTGTIVVTSEDSSEHTGTFTVDVAKRELTVIEMVDGYEEINTLKLQ